MVSEITTDTVTPEYVVITRDKFFGTFCVCCHQPTNVWSPTYLLVLGRPELLLMRPAGCLTRRMLKSLS